MTDLHALITRLQALESDGGLFGPEIEGFCLWPVLRSRCWQLLSGVCPDPHQGSLWQRLKAQPSELLRFAFALRAVRQRRRIRGRDKPFFILSAEAFRSVRRAQGWWDVYLDDIALHPDIRDRHVRCEVRAHALPLRPTMAPRHLFSDAQLIDQVWHGLFGKDPEAEAAARDLTDLLAQKLRAGNALPAPADWQAFCSYSRQRARMFRRALRWYAELFESIQVRVLLLTDAYNQHGAVAAARRCGMRVLELQHGDIPAYHQGYSWTEAARPFRSRMPLPTHIGTYGPHWSRILRDTGFWADDQVFDVGSVRMDWTASQMVRVRNPDEPVTVVYTTQQPIRARALALWRETLQLACASGFRFKLRVKVHRIERKATAEYAALADADSDVEVIPPYEGDTLAAIAHADVHVSAWSTCHFEALGLNVPTVVLQFPDLNVRMDLPESPLVRVARSARELLDQIRASVAPDATATTPDAGPLFTPHARENTVRLLTELNASEV